MILSGLEVEAECTDYSAEEQSKKIQVKTLNQIIFALHSSIVHSFCLWKLLPGCNCLLELHSVKWPFVLILPDQQLCKPPSRKM